MNSCHNNMIEAQNIAKSYNGIPIIKDVSLSASKGQIVSLLGISGIGKTTLFNIMSGLEKPDSGNIILDGKDITGKSGRVSYMQQKDLLLPFYTVLHNVSMPLILRGVNKKEAYGIALEFFEEFGLVGREKKYPSQLSGGMRQRAALLRSYLFSG